MDDVKTLIQSLCVLAAVTVLVCLLMPIGVIGLGMAVIAMWAEATV